MIIQSVICLLAKQFRKSTACFRTKLYVISGKVSGVLNFRLITRKGLTPQVRIQAILHGLVFFLLQLFGIKCYVFIKQFNSACCLKIQTSNLTYQSGYQACQTGVLLAKVTLSTQCFPSVISLEPGWQTVGLCVRDLEQL